MFSFVTNFVVLATFALIGATLAHAQVSTGELVGSVTDASGAAVPKAKLIATNTATGAAVREATSSESGDYVMTLLPPGTYNISVEAAGFRKTVQNSVPLQVNQRARLDFAMQIGQVTEILEVSAAPPLLESQSSAVGTVVNQQFVSELPLNGRNFVQLAILTPGVNGAGFSVGGTIQSGARPDDRRPGTEIFSNGNREGSNNFLYDGVDNNERLIQLIVLRPAIESIREFKVQTNMYSADVGRNSGAVIDVVTKSGTNQLHGSAFEFLRNSALDARSYYNAKGTPFPPFRYNQYGFSLGGPIVLPKLYNGRSKTFFFADFEGYRRNTVASSLRSVATTKIRGGDFSDETPIFDPLNVRNDPTSATGIRRTQFPGNIIPQNRWDVPARRLLSAFPLPSNPTARVNNYLANLNLVQNWDQGDVRVDHQISSNDNIFFRWSIQHTTTTAPHTFPLAQIDGLPKPVGVGNEDSFAGPAFNPVQHMVLGYTKVFSPRLVGDFRAGFNRFVLDYTSDGYEAGGPNLGNLVGIPNSNSHPLHTTLPIINLGTYTGVGHSRSLPIFRRSNTFQYIGNMTYSAGKHTLKFGGDFRRRQITEYQTNRGNGRFNFSRGFTTEIGSGATTGNELASFALGYASLVEQDFTLAWVGARGVENGIYFADDWRVSRNLTLNIGMRWDYYSPFSEVANRWANFDSDTATVKVAGVDGVDRRAGVQRDFSNWAPRLGFAYQLNSKTVVRGGFGLFYNPNGNGGALLRLQRHVPFGPIVTQANNDVTLGTRMSQGFAPAPVVNLASAKTPAGGVVGVFPGYKSSYAQQFNLGMQHQITGDTIIKVSMVGNLGRRLGTGIDLNQPLPGPGAVNNRRPFFGVRPGLAGISYAVSDGLSAYLSGQLEVQRRMTSGLSVMFGYTWAHGIDDVGTEFGGGTGTPQDIRNRRADRGNSVYDIRHRATVSSLYRLPFGKSQKFLNRGGPVNLLLGGWQVNNILIMQTGLPFTVGHAGANTGGAGGSRADFVRDATLPEDQRTLQRWFDTTAFATPAIYTFGNLGRNTLYGPGRWNLDSSLFKDFLIKERLTVQFRAEAFNLFNHPQFGQPNATLGTGTVGTITSTVGNPRQLQLALRVQF